MENSSDTTTMIPRVCEDSCQNLSESVNDQCKYDKTDDTTSEIGVISKRQMKKIRKKEKWLERKGEKRLRERIKAKEKRAHARANNIDLGPSRKALKKCTMAESDCKVTITIDTSFDELMLDKDVAKLIKQILRCYTLNRRAASPIQFSLTGFQGKSKQEMQKHNGYEHWDLIIKMKIPRVNSLYSMLVAAARPIHTIYAQGKKSEAKQTGVKISITICVIGMHIVFSMNEYASEITLLCKSVSCGGIIIFNYGFEHLKTYGEYITTNIPECSKNAYTYNIHDMLVNEYPSGCTDLVVKFLQVKFYPDPYSKIYEKEKIVYLTSESENIIDTLESDCVYVIGGLVDHNSHKGHCHKLAIHEGVRHARLPLDKFMKMKARKVLTVDHVFEILLRVTEGKTWQEAFMQVLPERKNAQPVLSMDKNCSKDSLDSESAKDGNDDDAKVMKETIKSFGGE